MNVLLKIIIGCSSFISFCSFMNEEELILCLLSLVILGWSIREVFNAWLIYTEPNYVTTCYGNKPYKYYHSKSYSVNNVITNKNVCNDVIKCISTNTSIVNRKTITQFVEENKINNLKNKEKMNTQEEVSYVGDSTIMFDEPNDNKTKSVVMEGTFFEKEEKEEKKNNCELVEQKRLVYVAIIKALREKNLSVNNAYNILQNIANVEVKDSIVVTLYSKVQNLFGDIDTEFIIDRIRLELGNKDMLLLIRKADISIADYFLKYGVE